MSDQTLPTGLINPPPSKAEVAAAKQPDGTWTREQITAWGISYPPQRGWQEAVAVARKNAGLEP